MIGYEDEKLTCIVPLYSGSFFHSLLKSSSFLLLTECRTVHVLSTPRQAHSLLGFTCHYSDIAVGGERYSSVPLLWRSIQPHTTKISNLETEVRFSNSGTAVLQTLGVVLTHLHSGVVACFHPRMSPLRQLHCSAWDSLASFVLREVLFWFCFVFSKIGSIPILGHVHTLLPG